MSLVHELAACVQCCFELFGTQTDGVLLSQQDQAQLNEVSSILQPVLLRLQKHAVAVSQHSELFVEDEQLLSVAVQLRQALQSLQASAGRCKASHWLVRVLTAEDVRLGLQAGLNDTANAVQQLLKADAAASVGPLSDVEALRSSLLEHKVEQHEALERLGAGLYKHMEQATDAEQVVSMLRFVVREAQNLMMRRKQARDSSSSSGTDRRESDTSDTSRNDQVRKPASADANGSATPMDTGSSSDDGSSNNSSCLNNNSEGSKHAGASSSKSKKQSGKPSDVPPGDTSLTDVQLLLAIQQLADSKLGTQQLVLQQVLSILEELHDQKAHHLKQKQSRRNAAAAAAAGAAGGHLQSVPEGPDGTIAAVRAASDADYHTHPNGGAVAAMAAARLANGGGPPVTYGCAVAAVTTGLEELLWSDPWDAAALTQLLELLLQASTADEEYVETEEHRPEEKNNRGSKGDGRGKDGGRKWWGNVGAAAKAALQTAAKSSKGSGRKAAGKSGSDAAAEVQRRQRQERTHQLVSSALDVLLHLTPLPAGSDSCFKPLVRQDVSTHRSLALPLMAHCDTVKALAGCIWSSWTDVSQKAARLITILMRSEQVAGDSASLAAASGYMLSPVDILVTFCHSAASTGGTGSNIWHGLVTMLHGSNLVNAAAAAEALAAIGSCAQSHELCSSLAASQAARPLLLLLSKYQDHLGAGGAAAAALQALADPMARPGMHDLLVSSYTETVNSTSVPLGESCVSIMLSTDCLAACRAACLSAALAHGVDWATAPSSANSDRKGSLWAETFRAGQHVLQRTRTSSSSGGEEGSPTVAGAVLLKELVVQGCKQSSASAESEMEVDDRSREDLCLEALVLVVQKLRTYDVSRTGKQAQVQALLDLVGALVSHISEARVCGVLPELFAVVVPLLEELQCQGGDSSLHVAAQRLHEQLMVLGG